MKIHVDMRVWVDLEKNHTNSIIIPKYASWSKITQKIKYYDDFSLPAF